MEKKDLKELKTYLEKIASFLYHYPDIESNILALTHVADKSQYILKNIHIEEETQKKHLTSLEVYYLAREIVKKIDASYLPLYDNMLSSGILDFSYDASYEDSQFKYIGRKKLSEININREFTYQDVVVLIHEFMHYANYNEKNVPKLELFTEFFSIYYEFYAIKYLTSEKQVPACEINALSRIKTWEKNINLLYKIEYPLMSYMLLGDFDLELFNTYIAKYTKEQFDYECAKSLELFKKIEEKNYKVENEVLNWYKYGLGTSLAMFSLYNIPEDVLLRFYKEISNEENEDLSLVELFTKYRIPYQRVMTKDLDKSVNNYLSLVKGKKKNL